jgi:hypothetical protein
MKILILALLICIALPAVAQQTDDQTGDYADQDRRYYERFVKPEARKRRKHLRNPRRWPMPTWHRPTS